MQFQDQDFKPETEMHIVPSPDWTTVDGSQQASLESTGLCAGLAALGH